VLHMVELGYREAARLTWLAILPHSGVIVDAASGDGTDCNAGSGKPKAWDI
jgi:hypothetical protein